MADILMVVGQALSVTGLLYGWYLTLTFCAEPADENAARRDLPLLHHIAMA